MNCKNCGSKIADGELFCGVCGAKIGGKSFKLAIPKEKMDDIRLSHEENETATQAEAKEPAFDQVKQEEKEQTIREETAEEKTKEETKQESKQDETGKDDLKLPEAVEAFIKAEKSKAENAALQSESTQRSAATDIELRKKLAKENAQKRKAAEQTKMQNKKVRSADIFMKVLVCVCAAVIIALTAVGAFTGVFDETPGEKTVVLSSFSQKEKDSFETDMLKYASLFENGYDSQRAVADDILAMMNPSDSSGLYALYYGKAAQKSIDGDPLVRFTDENGCCKIEAKKITALVKALGATALNDANCKDYYYYDGSYYFRAQESTQTAQKLALEVVSSKKTSDGNFYAVCNVYPESAKNVGGETTAEESTQRYFLVSKNEKDGETSWTLLKISTEPLYDELGSKIVYDDGENSLSFVMQRKTVTAKTSDGKVFAKYIVEYPSFESDGVTQLSVKTMYSDMISSFRKKAKKADSLYSKYIENGGTDEALPLYTHVISSVKLNENGCFAILERITDYDPLALSEDATPLLMPKTQYEGFTFKIADGEFVKKDEVMGKDYLAVQDMLYKKWLGADEAQEGVNIPADTNEIGQAIYSSAWVLTKNGISFCYQSDNFSLEEITLPYSSLPERTVMQ